MPFVKPSNRILVGGTPLVEELVTEGTTCKPRLFVKKGTGDHQAHWLETAKKSLWAFLMQI